jgi:hypothetical protein
MEHFTNNISYDLYESQNIYIYHLKYYHAHFNEIPNIKTIYYADKEKVKKFIYENYKEKILKVNSKTDASKLRSIDIEEYYFVLKNKIVVYLNNRGSYILYSNINDNFVDELSKEILRFTIKHKNNKSISFIVNRDNNLTTKPLKINSQKINMDWHYNNNFKEINNKIISKLRINNSKGLFLFYGEPGTGKSTYIKYLIQKVRKEVIFLSPKMAANLDNISFIEFLLENPNKILVIEDAEELIVSRDNKQNSQLSFLLNLTDGIISDNLGIQIIATFNTDLKNIDKALLRKGRLTVLYKFEKLEVEKANALAKHLKFDYFETNTPMTLADIFNYNEKRNESVKLTKIGFLKTS